MNIPVRMPRIAASGHRVVVDSVVARPGTAVNAGDQLMTLRIGSFSAALHSELSGLIRDVRVAPNDEIVADRVVLWMESPTPPPISSVGASHSEHRTAALNGDGETVFRLPDELLPARTLFVQSVLAHVGEKVKPGAALLEVALGPLRFAWPSPTAGKVVEVLVHAGHEIVDGAPVLRFAHEKRKSVHAPPPAKTTARVAPLRRTEIPELTLAEFRQTTKELSERMTAMAALVDQAGLANCADLLRAGIAKLSDCRFTVAVVGEFKRGKSTFLNALVGGEFLPNDVIPCTAFACRFQYGEQVELALVGLDGVEIRSPFITVPEIIAELDRLTRDPRTSIREAIIRLPLNLCRDGVDLIDTPGLNDSQAMNQVTLSVLPNVDAAVLLLIPESPLSDTERRFLEDHLLARDISRILFVLTATDRIPEPQLPRLVDYIQGQIRSILAAREGSEISDAALLCISSRRELLNPGAIDSGFQELRGELNRLLFRERGRLILMQTLQRVRRAAGESMSTVKLRIARLAMSRESFHGSLEEIDDQLELTRLHANEIRRRLAQGRIEAEQAAVTQAQPLYLTLLALRETLPSQIVVEQLKRGSEAIRAELGAAFQQNTGKLYQQTLTALIGQIRSIYEPVAEAVRAFVEHAEKAFQSRASKLYREATAAPAGSANHRALPIDVPDNLNFSGNIIGIDISLSARSWMFLAESATSFLSAGEFASSIESRALAKLRESYGEEIERQVRTTSNEAILSLKFAEFARSPFNDLIHRFDQEVSVLLGDSFAILASLRASATQDEDSGIDWNVTHQRIETILEQCEAVVFADGTESLEAA